MTINNSNTDNFMCVLFIPAFIGWCIITWYSLSDDFSDKQKKVVVPDFEDEDDVYINPHKLRGI
jgi:hypothetical protein